MPPLFSPSHAVPLGCGLNPLPRLVPIGVANALDLVEAGDRVSHVSRVVQRLLPLLREGERRVTQIISLLCGHTLALARAFAVTRVLGLLDVLAGCGLLLLRG